MTEPLPLPENFNPETLMFANVTENGVFHESRKGAALAERVLEVVLGCQERRAGDPHHGNFFWMLEDDVVQDLNAVEFNLEHLIPMMLQHGDRLSPDLRARVLEAVRHAEIAGRGYRKLVEWMAFTDMHGIPYEYNSPTYTAVTVRARTALARLGLSAGLHIHAGTGRWAGPHSRAYQPSVVCETAPEAEMMQRWIAEGALKCNPRLCCEPAH